MTIIRLQGDQERQRGVYYEYDIDAAPLGEGGMGRVYKGYMVNERTGQRLTVAIKAIYEDIPENVVERARREAAIMLDHENLIRMYGFVEVLAYVPGATEPQKHYHVVMEHLSGVTLEEFMQGKVTDAEGKTIEYAESLYSEYTKHPAKVAGTIMKAVLAGLMGLHDKGYIHRDIDPSNIMITADGKIKLIDFGICKQIVNLATHDRQLTAAGVFMGKVNYAAPELVIGDINHQDFTTDIYAMGVLLYQIIAGYTPFSGTDQEVLNANLHKKLPLRPIKDANMRRVIRKATEKTQSRRYPSAAEMRVDIERAMRGQRATSRGWLVAAIALCVIGLGVLAYILMDHGTQTDTPVAEASKDIPINPDAATAPELLANALARLASSEPDTARTGLQALASLAQDSAYAPAMYEYGLTFAQANKWFDEPLRRQTALDTAANKKLSNMWMARAFAADTLDYKAAYWLVNNFIEDFSNDQLSAEGQKRFVETFYTFKRVLNASTDAEADAYRNAIVEDEKTMREAWGLIK